MAADHDQGHYVRVSDGTEFQVSREDAARLTQALLHGPAALTVSLDAVETLLAVQHVVSIGSLEQ